jgi:hypothetical protein
MNISSLFSVGLPFGRIIILAWITASILHVQWGITIFVRDVSSVEFILQAGLLFGYFTVLMAIGRLIAFLVLLLIFLVALGKVASTRPPIPGPDPITRLTHNPLWQSFQRRFGRVLANLADIAAMFTAFLLYSEIVFRALAPIGLVIVLVMFALGRFDETASSDNRTEGSN